MHIRDLHLWLTRATNSACSLIVFALLLSWSFLALLTVFSQSASAAGLEVTNAKLVDRDEYGGSVDIEFDIAWKNSWRARNLGWTPKFGQVAAPHLPVNNSGSSGC